MSDTGPMLNCPTTAPDPRVGAFVHSFLREAPWLRRRVETISFKDVDTVERRTTLDIGIAELKGALGDCPVFEDRPLVPLVMLSKDLLINFDLTDRTGAVLPAIPREVDAFFGWSALASAAAEVLDVPMTNLPTALSSRLSRVAYDFPDGRDSPNDSTLHSWAVPSGWSSEDQSAWQRLLTDDGFARLLRDFTFHFLLITQIPIESAIHVVKFRYDEFLPYSEIEPLEKIGLQSTEMDVLAPAVGWARSYHLRVEAPSNLRLTDVGLFRVRTIPAPAATSVEYYQAREGAEVMQVYTTSSVTPDDYVLAVSLRVPILGYLRAMWFTAILAALVLLLGWKEMDRLETAVQGQADAAIALLLVAPSLIAAYLVRPGEHAIASRLLRPVRYAVASSGLLAYLAGGCLVLRMDNLDRIWAVLACLSVLPVAYISCVVWRTWREMKPAADSSGRTVTREIEIFDLE